MTPSARLALTVLAALIAAALTIAVAAWAVPSGPVSVVLIPLVLLAAAALVRWRR